jgi:periplasmic protein TonB
MTAASPGPQLFSILTGEHDVLFRPRKDAFLLSLLGQAAILAVIVYLTSCAIRSSPAIAPRIGDLDRLPLVFSGLNGGGGGNHARLPASNGSLPEASLEPQIVPPTVIVPKEPPKLAAPETVVVAPDIKLAPGALVGDPSSLFSNGRSDGKGGPDGIGDTGCCGGVGNSFGPHAGEGPSGPYPAGQKGVSVPEVIYSPEPSFSDEARQAKFQGVVLLMLVVGPDGRPYNVRVRQSLGMGLDEKAIEAVKNWRFHPAIRNGQPVAAQIGVQIDFHLY